MASQSIQKRPSGTWRARYRDQHGKEYAQHFPRKADAQRWLAEVTASTVTGQYVDPRAGKIIFKAYFAQWSAPRSRSRRPPQRWTWRTVQSRSPMDTREGGALDVGR